jgi:hypothetical protein
MVDEALFALVNVCRVSPVSLGIRSAILFKMYTCSELDKIRMRFSL